MSVSRLNLLESSLHLEDDRSQTNTENEANTRSIMASYWEKSNLEKIVHFGPPIVFITYAVGMCLMAIFYMGLGAEANLLAATLASVLLMAFLYASWRVVKSVRQFHIDLHDEPEEWMIPDPPEWETDGFELFKKDKTFKRRKLLEAGDDFPEEKSHSSVRDTSVKDSGDNAQLKEN